MLGDPLQIPIGGTFVRCTAATYDFQISIDGSPPIPFGVARSIATKNADGSPQRFSRIDLIAPEAGYSGPNTITLVVGVTEYVDSRTAFFPDQQVQVTHAECLKSNNIALTGGNDSVQTLAGFGLGSFSVNIRNMDAVNGCRIIVSGQGATVATLTAGRGYYLGPGENVDLPVDSYYVYIRGTAAQVIVVSALFYTDDV